MPCKRRENHAESFLDTRLRLLHAVPDHNTVETAGLSAGETYQGHPFHRDHKPQATKKFFVASGNQLTYGIDKSSASCLLPSQSQRPDLPSAFPPSPAASATTTFASHTSSICHPAPSPEKENHLAWTASESAAMTVFERPHVPLEILGRRTRTRNTGGQEHTRARPRHWYLHCICIALSLPRNIPFPVDPLLLLRETQELSGRTSSTMDLPLAAAVIAGTRNGKTQATLLRQVFLKRSGITVSGMSTKNLRAEHCLYAFTELHLVPALVP
jgi:hypothetical protein